MYAISMLCVIGIAFFAGEDMSVALYTALIISFFFACIAVVDIDRYAKKLKTLDELCGTITHLSRALPRGEGGLEKAYTHVLEELRATLCLPRAGWIPPLRSRCAAIRYPLFIRD